MPKGRKKKIWLSRDDTEAGLYTFHLSYSKPKPDSEGIFIGVAIDGYIDPKLFHAMQKNVRLRKGQCVEIIRFAMITSLSIL